MGINGICTVTSDGLNDISKAMEAISKGNLRHRVNSRHKGFFNDIAVAVNGSFDSLSRLIGEVRASGRTAASLVGESSVSADDLALQTERNAATLEENTISLSEMARSHAAASKAAHAGSSEVAETTAHGLEIMNEASSAMEAIQARSAGLSG